MSITLTLTPEQEAVLRERAAQLGETPDALAGQVLASFLQDVLRYERVAEPGWLTELAAQKPEALAAWREWRGAVGVGEEPDEVAFGEAVREFAGSRT